jgi:monoamine oxidase
LSVQHTRVAIVGGGLSGLYAAWRLQQWGVQDVVLFEARGLLGGRILGADAAGQVVAPGSAGSHGVAGIDRFDLGPAWFWPEAQPQLDGVVHALGLRRFEQFDEGDMVVERSPQSAPVRTRGWRSAPASVRLLGGMGALVEALRRPLSATQVRTGHAVRRLAVEGGRIELHTTGDAAVWSAEHVLLALPPRLAVHSIAFTPGLPPALEHSWRATDTWMAPHAKVVALYDTPFWRAQGLSGHARSACGPMVEVHDASVPGGHAALFGFIGVPARVRRGVAEDVLRAHCCAQLGRLFGPQALAPRAVVLKDWALDAHTATEADLGGDGQHPLAPAREASEGPWRGRLTGIGSEWSPQFPGYLAGAVEAAEQGVQAWAASAASAPNVHP